MYSMVAMRCDNLYMFLGYVVVSSLTCFLPYLLGFEPVDTDVSTVGYNDAMKTVIVALSCCFPIILDTLMDSKHPDTVMLPRWTHLLTLIIPNGMLYCLPPSPVLLVGCSFARELLFRGALMSHMFNDPEFFTAHNQRIFGIVIVVFSLDLNLRAWYTTLHSVIPRYIFRLATGLVGFSLLLVLHVVIKKVASMYEQSEKPSKSTTKGMLGHKKYCHYYSVLLMVSLVAKVVIRYAVLRNSFATINDGYSLYGPQNLCDVFFSVVAALIPLHVLRHDKAIAEEYSQKVHSVKASFLSYVYREMRCALHTLQHIVSQSIHTNTPTDGAPTEMSWDEFYGICALSNSLLDEVLLLDDVFSGSVKYTKETIKIKDILHSAAQPLKLKAKQADVKLSLDSTNMRPAADTDQLLVHVDVFSLTISLRTLLEYSIVHSSTGCVVNVCLSQMIKSTHDSTSGVNKSHSDPAPLNMVCIDIVFNSDKQMCEPCLSIEDHIYALDKDCTTGIGLSAVSQIVERHRGMFSATDVPTPRFQVLLPCTGAVLSNHLPQSSEITQDEDVRRNTGRIAAQIGNLAEADSVNLEPSTVALSAVNFPCVMIVSPENSPDASVIRETLCGYVDVIKQVHSESQIIEYINNHCTWSKRISIIFLIRSVSNKKPHVLALKWRKMGYDGVIVLISDLNYPDSNERFLAYGGDAVLLCPITGDRLVRRVDVEEVLLDAYSLTTLSNSPLPVKWKKCSVQANESATINRSVIVPDTCETGV